MGVRPKLFEAEGAGHWLKTVKMPSLSYWEVTRNLPYIERCFPDPPMHRRCVGSKLQFLFLHELCYQITPSSGTCQHLAKSFYTSRGASHQRLKTMERHSAVDFSISHRSVYGEASIAKVFNSLMSRAFLHIKLGQHPCPFGLQWRVNTAVL